MRQVSTTLSRRLLTGVGFGLAFNATCSFEAIATECGFAPLQCYQGVPATQISPRWQGAVVPTLLAMPQSTAILSQRPILGPMPSAPTQFGLGRNIYPPMNVQPFTTTPQLRGPFQIRVSHSSHANGNAVQAMNLQWAQSLEAVNIQVKNDGLDVKPQLNVNTHDGRITALRTEGTRFVPFWNYGNFIGHAEIRILSTDKSARSYPLMVLPVQNGMAILPPFSRLPENVTYVLRVYNHKGQFDETRAQSLTLVERSHQMQSMPQHGSALSGYGIDRTAIRNIKVRGSSVTVYGENASAGSYARIGKIGVPIDEYGKFVMQMILPYGHYPLNVDVGANGQMVTFKRDIHVEDSEFFYVALGEVTVGKQTNSGPANFLAANDEDLEGKYVKGRGAMYLKGKFRNDIRVTAAIDTGEERLQDIFKNLDKKDPRQLLRRLDGDRFYPVYGDGSVLVEDAPTQGKFYVRVEKDDSHAMFGNFVTNMTGTEFAHLDRGLYGGIIDYKSLATTQAGDRKTSVTGFAAEPGTVPARNEFRGTGGSLYFLDRQDVTIGSERLRVEVRDKISGLVIETRNLRAREDYDFDYIQGRILLHEPLQSTAADEQIVRGGALSGNDVVLVVRYEYTPTLTDVSGYTFGGRMTQWLGNVFRIGLTGQTEKTNGADQKLLGVDGLLRYSENTYLKGEYAKTKGPAFGQNNSTDGGFNFVDVSALASPTTRADAVRVEGAVDFEEVSYLRGSAQVYYDFQDAGFSGAGRLSVNEQTRLGGRLTASLNTATEVSVKYDEIRTKAQGKTKNLYGHITQAFGNMLSMSLGVRHGQREVTSAGYATGITGKRTDATAQVELRGLSNWKAYVFGQKTVARASTRQRNDRVGVGAEFKLSSKLNIEGEVSEGNLGFGARARAVYHRSDNSEYYLGYTLSPDRSVAGFGNNFSRHTDDGGVLNFGTRVKYSDALSVYGEERFSYGQDRTAYTHAYGLTFTPTDLWTFGASIENGVIEDVNTGDFDRTAFTLSAGRTSDLWRFATSLEGRFEEGVNGTSVRDRTTWLMRNIFAVQATRDWEILGRYNFAVSDSDQSDILNSEFTEAVLAAAYRPIYHDKLNALLKYTYFEDLSPATQMSNTGQRQTVRQRSQVLSLDGIYDLTDRLSVGVKYGFRFGEVALDRTSDTFIRSDAHIAVLRLDYNMVNQWDILAEARVLSSSLTDEEKYGALIGVYRHVGKNAKIGVGYNFARFSDDLTNFENDSKGYFINLVGKF